MRRVQATGWHPELDARVLAGAMWAAVHGLATLWLQGAYATAIPRASLDDALATTLELMTNVQQGDDR